MKKIRIIVYQDKQNLYRWKAVARNNKIVACSGEGYKEERKLLDALDKLEEFFYTYTRKT
jgi:uncharacterized protein YegP (UPF0339 family)